MNQGKLDIVKQEIARLNIDFLTTNELKWMGTGKFNSDDHYIYYCGKNPTEEREKPSKSTRVQNAALGCNLKSDRMISVHFQGKLFNM